MKNKLFFTAPLALSLLMAGSISSAEQHEPRQLGSHQHGVGQLNVALEQKALYIELISPAMNIVGFEHVADTAKEKKIVHSAIEILEDSARVFSLPTEAQCQPAKAEVETDIGSEHHDKEEKHKGEKHAAHAEGSKHEEEVHSEFHVSYELSCAKPDALTHIDVNLFALFPATEELEAQVIGEQGQTSVKLTADSARIKL